MLKFLEYANVWTRDFPTLKLISAVNCRLCSEFAMRSEIERARSIAL